MNPAIRDHPFFCLRVYHSVGVLVPFVQYYFPRARIVPILIDVNARQWQLRALRSLLIEFLKDPKILAVLSMDFSHNSTAAIADLRDAGAEKVISQIDADQAGKVHVDCHKGLWLLLSSLSTCRRRRPTSWNIQTPRASPGILTRLMSPVTLR